MAEAMRGVTKVFVLSSLSLFLFSYPSLSLSLFVLLQYVQLLK
jgi:hypothetical protein